MPTYVLTVRQAGLKPFRDGGFGRLRFWPGLRSDCLFTAGLKGQDTFDAIVIVLSSEFGRTLPSNGEGTDHAWGDNDFVLGGVICRGTMFIFFPESLLEGNDQDAGRGRLMPKYPWESVMAPIAEWMGADPSSGQRASVFH